MNRYKQFHTHKEKNQRITRGVNRISTWNWGKRERRREANACGALRSGADRSETLADRRKESKHDERRSQIAKVTTCSRSTAGVPGSRLFVANNAFPREEAERIGIRGRSLASTPPAHPRPRRPRRQNSRGSHATFRALHARLNRAPFARRVNDKSTRSFLLRPSRPPLPAVF